VRAASLGLLPTTASAEAEAGRSGVTHRWPAGPSGGQPLFSRHLLDGDHVPKAPSDLQTHTSTLADGRMVVTRRVHAGVDEVWAVLADGWQYAT
jgi:hypothetical protein